MMLTVPVLVIAASTLARGGGQASQAWLDRFNGASNMRDGARDVAVDGNGDIYIVGSTFVQVQSNYFAPRCFTMKYDSRGTLQWTRMYTSGIFPGAAAAYQVAVDANNDVIVAGATSGSHDWCVIKYDGAGNQLWVDDYQANSGFLTNPEDMCLDAAGNIYLTGNVGTASGTAATTIKYDGSGTLEWVRQYLGPTGNGASAAGVTVDAAGNVYTAGATEVVNRRGELMVVKYDGAGTMMWLRTSGSVNPNGFDAASAITTDRDGAIVVVGAYSGFSPNRSDAVTLKYDPDGTLIWDRLYVGAGGGADGAEGVAVDSQNNLLIIGTTETIQLDDDVLILKYDPAGTLLWDAIYGGAGLDNDDPSDLALDSRDAVYVVGAARPFAFVDYYFTAKYDTSGAFQWDQQYGGPLEGESYAYGVAVAPDFGVYVTGDSGGPGTRDDIATIKYEQMISGPGDVNGDGLVNVLDLLELLGNWGPCPSCPADLNGDGVVDVLDLLEVLGNWG